MLKSEEPEVLKARKVYHLTIFFLFLHPFPSSSSVCSQPEITQVEKFFFFKRFCIFASVIFLLSLFLQYPFSFCFIFGISNSWRKISLLRKAKAKAEAEQGKNLIGIFFSLSVHLLPIQLHNFPAFRLILFLSPSVFRMSVRETKRQIKEYLFLNVRISPVSLFPTRLSSFFL